MTACMARRRDASPQPVGSMTALIPHMTEASIAPMARSATGVTVGWCSLLLRGLYPKADPGRRHIHRKNLLAILHADNGYASLRRRRVLWIDGTPSDQHMVAVDHVDGS